MIRGKGPLRFRRTNYNEKGNYSSVPKWHRAAGPYDEGEYKQLVAICGYTVPPSIALFLGYKLTRAVTPTRGELCSKCEKVAADEAIYAKHHPSKKKEEVMADDITNDPEFKAWAAHLADDVIPKMKGSAMTISLAPSPESESDIKYAVELGLSIMLDKPIVIIAEPGQILPEKLRRVADRVVEVDWRNDPTAGQKAIADVIESMVGDES